LPTATLHSKNNDNRHFFIRIGFFFMAGEPRSV
jgi:hypothetical protein